jgi:hypothetical protein
VEEESGLAERTRIERFNETDALAHAYEMDAYIDYILLPVQVVAGGAS